METLILLRSIKTANRSKFTEPIRMHFFWENETSSFEREYEVSFPTAILLPHHIQFDGKLSIKIHQPITFHVSKKENDVTLIDLNFQQQKLIQEPSPNLTSSQSIDISMIVILIILILLRRKKCISILMKMKHENLWKTQTITKTKQPIINSMKEFTFL